MSKENNPEDLESTIRLDMRKISNPYDDPTPPSVDSIEDILSYEDFSTDPTVSYDISEETIISVEDNIDFDELTKEMNELSNEFDDKTQETTITVDKPIKEKVATKVDKPIKEETAPKEMPSEDRPDVPVKPITSSTDTRKVKKAKPPTVKKQQPDSNANKPSNGVSMAMLGISLIALIAGLAGAWASMSTQSQIDALSSRINVVQNDLQNYQSTNQQSELVAVQKQLISLKQDVDSLKVKRETIPLTNNVPVETTIKPVVKVSPAVITPVVPIKEVKPTPQKNTWSVIISSHDSMKKAKREQQREVIKGIQTSIVAVVVKGNNWYRIVATGFADKQQAVSFAHKLKKQGITDAWVQYNK